MLTEKMFTKHSSAERFLTQGITPNRPLVFFMKKYCETGYRIARATEECAHVADDILAHHERWNGSGYPQGLKGEAIPQLARIIAIVDAFEVMSNGRPYKMAMVPEAVRAEIERCAGSQFDPRLTEIFL